VRNISAANCELKSRLEKRTEVLRHFYLWHLLVVNRYCNRLHAWNQISHQISN